MECSERSAAETYQTFTGLATATTPVGGCTDDLTTAGQTGYNPPAICGTNTGYHSEALLPLPLPASVRRVRRHLD
jgi:hypothetical protein